MVLQVLGVVTQGFTMPAPANLTHEAIAPDEWKELLEDILPPQGAWSEEKYLTLTDHSNRLVEYTDGFLEPLPMPTDRHQTILKLLFLAFHQFIDPLGGTVQFAALRLRIRPGKYREPDLLLLQSAHDPRRQERFWTGADLALEVVSADKPGRDLHDKPVDYAEIGVPEYWIVDPETETITVLQLKGDKYSEAGRFARGSRATSMLLPGFGVDVSTVFDAK
jgi:Uma2 family endonuclease